MRSKAAGSGATGSSAAKSGKANMSAAVIRSIRVISETLTSVRRRRRLGRSGTCPKRLQFFQQLFGFGQARKGALGLAELPGMDAPPHSVVIDRIAQVQHLMEHDIFERQGRSGRAVEDAADDDGVVRRIEGSEQAAGEAAAPAEQRAAEQAVEILAI